MWSSDRRAVLLALAALAGCGFRPAYGPGGAGNLLRGRLQAAAPRTPLDFAFVEQFETRLGRAAGAPFRLDYRIDTREDALAITADQAIQRYNLIGRVDYTVVDIAREAEVVSGSLEDFTSYSAIGTTVATRASQRDAVQRLAVILADRLATELLATAGAWAL